MSLNISISDDEAKVELISKNKKQYKVVSLSELITKLLRNNKLSTGILPSNTKIFSGTPSSYKIVIESLGRKRRFMYREKKYNIPFPTCCFVFHVESNILRRSFLFSTAKPIVSESDFLYCFPFGNIYDDGRICWGDNTLPDIYNVLAFDEIVALFYSAPYNGDLFGRKNVRGNYTLFSLISALKNESFFPNNLLKKHSRFSCIKDLL